MYYFTICETKLWINMLSHFIFTQRGQQSTLSSKQWNLYTQDFNCPFVLMYEHTSQVYLVDDVDPVVELLPLQDRVQIVQPVLKVLFSVAERDDDGHFLQRLAVFGFEASARLHVGVLLFYQLQVYRNVKLHSQGTH